MASLEFHYGSFRIVFRFAGRKFQRSLKTDNERFARATLARLEENLARVELGQLLLPMGADVATFLLSDGRLDQKPNIGDERSRYLGTLLDEFLGTLTTNALEPTTEHCLRIHVRHFKRILGERLSLRAIDLSCLQRYVDTRAQANGLHGKKLSATTIKKEIATLNMIWTWAELNRFVDRPLPKKGLRYPKTSDKPPFQTIAEIERKVARGGLAEDEIVDLWDAAFLTLAEIEVLLAHVRRHALHRFLYPMFVFAAHTGARRSEMRRSRIEDLDFEGRRIFIRERKRVRGRHTLRSVPMSPILLATLQDWLQEHPGGRDTFCLGAAVYKSSKPRHEPIPLTDDEVGHHFQQVLLGTKWEHLRGWHVFRHSFCSNCAAAGIDQRMINAWVGHQTEDMVRRYRHLIPNQEHAAIESVFAASNRETLAHAIRPARMPMTTTTGS
jgi:integrase